MLRPSLPYLAGPLHRGLGVLLGRACQADVEDSDLAAFVRGREVRPPFNVGGQSLQIGGT